MEDAEGALSQGAAYEGGASHEPSNEGVRSLRGAAPLIVGGAMVLALAYAYFVRFAVPLIGPLFVSNAYWLGLGFSGRVSLFGYFVFLATPVAGGSSGGLVAAAGGVTLGFAISTYLFTARILGKWYAGVGGAALAVLSPLPVAVARDAAYPVLLGVALLFPALLLAERLRARFSELGLIVFVLFSAAVTFADPLLGAVLAATLAVLAPWAFMGGNRKFSAVPAISALIALAGVYLIDAGPGLSSQGVGSPLVLLAAATAALALYFNWRTRPRAVALLGSLILVTAGAFIVVGNQLLFLALLIAASGLLAKTGRFFSSEGSGEQRFVHIDLAKLLSLLLILLLVGSDLTVAAAASRSASSADAGIVSRYGDTQLLQAMSWLRQNTPQGSLVLSEYPLSQWVQALGGRPVLSTVPADSSYQSFIASVDASTMLNSTYEMRNGYMRVRDWAPIAPQRSPSIAVASGSGYLDVLYIDENHLNLLNSTGAPITVPYSGFTKVSSGFEVVNGSVALQQNYIVDGVNVQRDVFMGTGAEVTVEYVFHANQTGIISGAQVKLWVASGRSVGYNSLTGGTLRLDLDAGNLVLTAKGPGQSLTFGPDKVYGQDNLNAQYSTNATSFAFSITIDGQNVKRVPWAKGTTETIDSLGLYKEYGVSYVIIPTIVKTEQLDLFGLYYPTFTSVYQNSKLTIYQVLAGPT